MRLIDADALWMEVIHTLDYCDDILEIIEHQKTIWSTHPNDSNTLETLDCIGRQEAIDEANAWLLECFEVQKQDRSCGLIRRLEDLPPAQPETQWIPRSERLPEENGEYLVTRESSSYRYIDIVRKSNCNSHLPMASDIKAWMPLPEPYKGEQE